MESHICYLSFCGCTVTVESRGYEYKQIWQDIAKWSRSIEVVYRTAEDKPIITRVYFPFDPKVSWA